jgi:hypothetical protein
VLIVGRLVELMAGQARGLWVAKQEYFAYWWTALL